MPDLSKFLDISPEVRAALDGGKPVVALESSDITHGIPYPQNIETALHAADLVRQAGATPATIAILGGRLKVGLSKDEVEALGKKGPAVHRASRRDIPVLIARGEDGATTVAASMYVSSLVGANVFATGGIGGVQRGGEKTLDISADLEELAHTPTIVVCAGVKSAMSTGKTLEYLETKRVPVIGYGTDEMPAFYTTGSGYAVNYRVDEAAEAARIFDIQLGLGLPCGMLVTAPIPPQHALEPGLIRHAIHAAAEEAQHGGVSGHELTAFMLNRVNAMTGGKSLEANIQLIYNNVQVAANIARELRAL